MSDVPANSDRKAQSQADPSGLLDIAPWHPDKRLFYRFMERFVYIACRLLFRIELVGRENIPGKGPLLIVPTHTSFLDPPMIGSTIGLHMTFLSREGILKAPLVGLIVRNLNTYRIRRGASDREAIRTCRRIIEAGWPLVFFPEGTRSRDGKLGRIQPGFAMILDGLRDTPYLPIMMQDTWRALPRGRIFPRPVKVRIVIGRSAVLPARQDGESRRAWYDRCCAELIQRYRELGAKVEIDYATPSSYNGSHKDFPKPRPIGTPCFQPTLARAGDKSQGKSSSVRDD